MEKKYDIFISYRRNGGETTAVLLKSELSHLGYHVFLDYDDLPIGGDFASKIQEVIASSSLFVFLYSHGCLNRCANEDDVLRKEIDCAIKNKKQILTLNINLATHTYKFPPKQAKIPKEITDKLGEHNFLDFFTGQYKQNSINRLAEFLAIADGLGFQKKQCTLELLSEIDATFCLDGNEITALRANTIKRVKVDYGKYQMTFKPANDKYFEETKPQEIIMATPTKEVRVNTDVFPVKQYHYTEAEDNWETMSAEEIREKGWDYQLTNNLHMAIKCWTIAAELGDPAAQYSLGYNYAKGDFLPRDETKAFEWYLKAARQGDSRSQFLLGDAYYYGTGTIRNYESAIFWYKKASEQGNAKALYSLACCYHKGQGIKEPDIKKAFELYLKAAEKGYHNAQLLVARFYEYGEDTIIPKDTKKALEWYQKAANQGSETAKIYCRKLEEQLNHK